MRIRLLIVCAVALAAGCGGDDDETTVTETTTVIQTETVPPPPEPGPVETTPETPGGKPADPGDNGAAEAPRNCGRITFEENTDSGAFDIKAAGTDCKTARAVARAARDSASEVSYTAQGFTCTGAGSTEPPLSSTKWFCLGADREVITFATS